jgi:uncharacterized protein YecE (DUF72 family)
MFWPSREHSTRSAAALRVVCEFRDASWYCDQVYVVDIGSRRSFVPHGSQNRHGPLVRTASWGFVRLHEGIATPRPHYGNRALARWVDRVAEMWAPTNDCFVYFNNDHAGCAVRDAFEFATRTDAGLTVHRTSPEPALTEIADGS